MMREIVIGRLGERVARWKEEDGRTGGGTGRRAEERTDG